MDLKNLGRTGWNLKNASRGADMFGGGYLGWGILTLLSGKSEKVVESKAKLKSDVWRDLLKVTTFLAMIVLVIYGIVQLVK